MPREWADLSDEALLGIVERTGALIVRVMDLPEDARRAQLPKGGGTPEANLFLSAHLFAAADQELQRRGIVA